MAKIIEYSKEYEERTKQLYTDVLIEALPYIKKFHDKKILIKYGGHDISPSSYFHRELFNMVGGFVVDYHYNMDDDLWIKFLMKGYSYKVINHWGWAYRIHEDSKTTATLMGVSSPKIDAEFDVIFKDNHHKWTKVGKLLKRFCKLFFSYPASRYYTLKYKDKDIHLINK